MVTTADSSSNHQSPTSTGFSGDSDSPKYPRKNLPCPWAQVVRGGDQESISTVHQTPPSSSHSSSVATSLPDQTALSDGSPQAAALSLPLDNSNSAPADGSDANNGNAARPKKPAWNKPLNGVVEVGPVMDAVSWPALSESTKAPPKLSAESASKTFGDASPSSSQQRPVTSHPPQKQASNVKANSSTNHAMSNRQRSMKRGGGSNLGYGHAQTNFTHPPPPPSPPPFPVFQVPTSYGNVLPGNNWDTRPVGAFVSQSYTGNDHRNTSWRGNFGPHTRGVSAYHNSYGGRRDHDRRNYANSRDTHAHQSRASPRGLVRPPPPNTSAFVTPPPVGPFPNPMGFPGEFM